ncbi:MAG: ABC transporter substrate-binding protein [Desulfobulbaceae bacterium BRH_c16a]|nr:MAG: ABC transporter substrate-binding protein [Desulfobulbaceae bacterium BRH_c16a]
MNSFRLLPLSTVFVFSLLFAVSLLDAAEMPPSSDRIPRRIVSLGPTNTENVYLLGAGDRLVANTSYCVHPEEARSKEKIGSVMQFSVEKVISLQPDLVLATNLSPDSQLQMLRNVGLTVVQFSQTASFAEVCDQFIALGNLLGLADHARELVRQASIKVAAIGREVSGLPKRKVFLQVGTRPLAGAIGKSFTHDFIALAGGENIIAEQHAPATDYEKVVADDPDVIIIAIMGSESGLAASEKEKWLSVSAVKAVRDNRVHVIDPDLVCSPSPLIFAETLATIAGLIHPELNWEKKP